MCQKCRPGVKCVDEPTTAESIEFQCPTCRGEGCEFCDNGQFEVVGCPCEMLDENIGELLELADLLKNGVTPVAGSVEDQPDKTMQALVMIMSEQRLHKAEKNPLGVGE